MDNAAIASWLGLIFAASEVALVVAKRARDGSADRGTLRVLWAVIFLSIFGGFQAAFSARWASLGPTFAPIGLGVGLVSAIAGLALRWYSILYLGRFFTVNVAIAADHRLIDSGPYRRIRHPSYTGALMAFLGIGLVLNNYLALLIIMLPTLAVFSWRIRVEEAALLSALGERYRAYMQRSSRLVPGVY